MARFNPDLLAHPFQSTPFAERSDSVSFHPAVDDLYVQLMDAIARIDSVAIDALISDDSLCVVPDGRVLQGRAQIQQWFESLFRAARREGMALRVRFELEDRAFCDGAICDRGLYSWNAMVGGSEMRLREGRFLAIFRPDTQSGRHTIDTMSLTPFWQGDERSITA